MSANIRIPMCFCISSHDSSDAHDNLSAALALLAAGQQVLAAVPIPGFPVVAGVLSEVIVRVQKTRTNHAALLTLSNRITNLVDAIMDAGEQIHLRINAFDNNDPRRLSLCKRLNQVSTHPEPIGQLLTELNALRDKANTLYQGPCLFRCLYSERDAQTIQSLQTGFDGALQLFQTRCAMLIMKDLEALIATTCVEQGQASLNNLVHADPAFRTDLHKEYSALLHGTRSALLADLEDWATATTPDTKPICILTGCAGTGKTAIAMEIAHRFHQQRRLGAAFAFLHTDGRDCGSAFFSSLAYELAENQETLRPHIVDAAIRLSGRRCRTKETARRLIEDPFRAAQGHQSPILLIIDDLDRYAANTSHHAPDILEVLMSCVKNSSFPLRTLLISRPEHSFEAVLDEYSTDVRRISLEDIPREVVDEDIEQFLRKSLSRTLPGRALLQDVPNGLSRVVQQAEGWFSHARAALNYLNADPEHMFSQLDVLLSNGPSRSGSVPLRDLDRMYAAVLTAAFPPTQMELLPEKQNRLQHVLGYVALLMTPISPGDLESLSLIPCTDSLPILNGLRSLVPIQRDGRDDKIRLLHSSFRGFLLDPKRCTNPLYSVDVSACHADLAECCLSTLTLLRPNVCRLREPNVPKAEWVGIAQRVKDYIPDHVQYACLHWADHLSGASGNERLISRLAVFSRESMKTWLEALGYMGQLDVAERALAAAHGWLDSERFADIRALLHEARLLVVAHRTEVDVCPYRIYTLAAQARTGPGIDHSGGQAIFSVSSSPSPPPLPPPLPSADIVSASRSQISHSTSMSSVDATTSPILVHRHQDIQDHSRQAHVEQDPSLEPMVPVPANPPHASPEVDDNLVDLIQRETDLTSATAVVLPTQQVEAQIPIKEASQDVQSSDDAMPSGSPIIHSDARDDDSDARQDGPGSSPDMPSAPVETTNPRWAEVLAPMERNDSETTPGLHKQSATSQTTIAVNSSSSHPGRGQQRPVISIVTSVPRRRGCSESSSPAPWASTPLSAQRRRPMQSM